MQTWSCQRAPLSRRSLRELGHAQSQAACRVCTEDHTFLACKPLVLREHRGGPLASLGGPTCFCNPRCCFYF